MTTVTEVIITGMVCQQCGEPLPTYRRGWSKTKMSRRKYCSLSCSNEGRAGQRQNRKTPTKPDPAPQPCATPVHCAACGRQIAADDTLPATVLAAAKANHRRYCGREDTEDGW